MPEFGRIDREFWRHPKVEECTLAAIGLWTVANAWCRDNRKSGFVPTTTALQLSRDQGELIGELVTARLWIEVDGGYRFKDWEHWNPDEIATTTAAKLVYRVVPAGHPDAVRQRLAAAVHALITDDGISPGVIEQALGRWLERTNAHVSLLPFLVSDLIRENKVADFREVCATAWRTFDVTPLEQRGHMFVPPTLPAGATVQEIRQYIRAAKRNWIEGLMK